MQTDLATLEREVRALALGSSISAFVGSVAIEPDDTDGTDILRVVVEVRKGLKAHDEEFAALAEAIEDKLGQLDERFASVRFDEAA